MKQFWVGFEKQSMDKNIISKLLSAADDPNLHVMIQGSGGRVTSDDKDFKSKLKELVGKEDFDWSITGKEHDFASTYERMKD
jgi:hypothetical protein